MLRSLSHMVADHGMLHAAVESGAEEDSDEEGDEAEYGTKSAAKAAAFWEGLLRPHHDRLLQAEQAAAAHAAPPGRLTSAPAASRRGALVWLLADCLRCRGCLKPYHFKLPSLLCAACASGGAMVWTTASTQQRHAAGRADSPAGSMDVDEDEQAAANGGVPEPSTADQYDPAEEVSGAYR